MKATILFILFAIITSLGHQPNLRYLRKIPQIPRQPTNTEVETDEQQPHQTAQDFYDNPPEQYKLAKEYFDDGNRFDKLMTILQNQNVPVSDAYYLCDGYNPKKTCQEFIDEIAKLL